MRRLLYFIVALAAFAFGSLIAFKFYWTHEPNSETVETVNTENNNVPFTNRIEQSTATSNSISTVQTDQNIPIEEKPKITCKDEELLPIWNELVKTSSYRDREKDYFSHDADCSEMLEVQKIDLNGDGQNELVLWGQPRNLCGATGNCDLWIYERKKDGYALLLEANGYNDGKDKWFEVSSRQTNKYRNILIKGHATGYETVEHYFAFDGTQYRESKCLFISYFPDPKGTVTTCKEAWNR